jgi:serpin B
MDEHDDRLDSAFEPLRHPPRPHEWASTEQLQQRAIRRRRHRLTAATGGTTVVLAAVLIVSLASFGQHNPELPKSALGIQRLAGPGGSYHLVADVKANDLTGTAQTQAEVALAEESFALRLTQLELSGAAGGNVVLSPLSAHVDLAMLELGSTGTTAREIATALQSSGLSPAGQAAAWNGIVQGFLTGVPAGEINLANSIWVQQRLRLEPGFLRQAAETFGNDTYQVDFAQASAAQAINAWVDAQTAGRIKKLYQPGQLSPSTEVVLANALHFHAAWQKGLFEEATDSNEPFYLSSGATISVPTIGDTDTLRVKQTSTYNVVELPYTTGRYAALLLEPTKGSVNALLGQLTTADLSRISSSLDTEDVDFSMPTLTLSADESLDGPLSSMGMAQVFESADFSPMLGAVGAINQQVGSVRQAVTLDVSRWGTDAAAATGVSVMPSSARAASTTIHVNHPYLLFIRDTKTGTILFSSVVNNPAGG